MFAKHQLLIKGNSAVMSYQFSTASSLPRSVPDGLRRVHAFDPPTLFEIGDRARDAQHAIKTSRGQPQSFGGGCEHRLRALIEAAPECATSCRRIHRHARSCAVAHSLDLAGMLHACLDVTRCLTGLQLAQ